MIPQNDVSVVIPAYNGADYIGHAVESILAQTYQPREIIVVDDGSTDDTLKVLAGYGEHIRLLTQPNRGIGAARNAGIKTATCDLFAFVDQDDAWHPHKLEEQIRLLSSTTNLSVCFTNYSFSGVSLPYKSGFEEFRKRLARLERSQISGIGFALTSPSLLEEFIRYGSNPCIPSTMVCRRGCFDIAGLFDEAAPPGLEDIQLFFRLAKYCKFAFVDKILMTRRYFQSKLNRPDEKERRIFMDTVKMLQTLHAWIPLSEAESRAVQWRVAQCYYAAGYFEFVRYNFAAARGCLWASARANLSREAICYLLLASCPVVLVQILRRIKHRLAAVR